MTLQECYTALEGNFDSVVGRLRSEKLVQKFVVKFLDDKSFDLLVSSLAEGNVEEAFRACHTIKGMCQNLSFTKLEQSSSALTEVLRGGDLEGGRAGLDGLRADYEQTVTAIRAYQDGQ